MTSKKTKKASKKAAQCEHCIEKEIIEFRMLQYKAAEQQLTWDMLERLHTLLDHGKPPSYIK